MRVDKPSPGFCLMVLTYALTFAFFAWGLTTPPLDRVWQLHHQLKTGEAYALSHADRELLVSAMTRHAALAEALLLSGNIGIVSAQRDGWIDTPEVTIIRTPRALATQRILLEIQTPPEHIPYRVVLSGPASKREIEVRERGILALDLPPPTGKPELWSLKLEGKGWRADPSSIAVRVTFDPPESSARVAEEDEEEREEDPGSGDKASGDRAAGDRLPGGRAQ